MYGKEGTMDYSLFYYTYSTIAQTLAGAFGFLIAAVLYQRQALSSRLSSVAELLESKPDLASIEKDRLRNLKIREEWVEYLRIARELRFGPRGTRSGETEIEELFERFQEDVDKLSSISKRFQWSLVFTGVTITACFILMPLTNKSVIGNPYLAGFFLIVTVAVAIANLWTYYCLLRSKAR